MTGFNSKRDAAADKLQEPVREALKLGLTALKNAIAIRNGEGGTMLVYPLEENAITAIKTALAQPAQEPPSEWEGIKAILDEYGLQAIDFVADFKAALALPAQEPERKALKLALEALEQLDGIDTETECVTIDVGNVIDAIKEALAQPAQEQRQWVGLTVQERNDCLVQADPCECLADEEAHQLMVEVEAKLRERNS